MTVLVRLVRRIFTRTCRTEGWLQYGAVLVMLVRGIFTRTCVSRIHGRIEENGSGEHYSCRIH